MSSGLLPPDRAQRRERRQQHQDAWDAEFCGDLPQGRFDAILASVAGHVIETPLTTFDQIAIQLEHVADYIALCASNVEIPNFEAWPTWYEWTADRLLGTWDEIVRGLPAVSESLAASPYGNLVAKISFVGVDVKTGLDGIEDNILARLERSKSGKHPTQEFWRGEYEKLSEQVSEELKYLAQAVRAVGAMSNRTNGVHNETFTPARIMSMLGCKANFLNKYAGFAEVQRPKKGERNFPYPLVDVLKILEAVIKRATDHAVIEKAKTAQKSLTNHQST